MYKIGKIRMTSSNYSGGRVVGALVCGIEYDGIKSHEPFFPLGFFSKCCPSVLRIECKK